MGNAIPVVTGRGRYGDPPSFADIETREVITAEKSSFEDLHHTHLGGSLYLSVVKHNGEFYNVSIFIKFGGKSGSSSSDEDGEGIDPTDTESGDETIQKGVSDGGEESMSAVSIYVCAANRPSSEKSESLDPLSTSCAAE